MSETQLIPLTAQKLHKIMKKAGYRRKVDGDGKPGYTICRHVGGHLAISYAWDVIDDSPWHIHHKIRKALDAASVVIAPDSFPQSPSVCYFVCLGIQSVDRPGRG